MQNFNVSLQKISASTLTQAVSSWLNSDSNNDQRDSTLTRLIFFIFTDDSNLTRLIWVGVESNLTHDSWVKHNSACYNTLWKRVTIAGRMKVLEAAQYAPAAPAAGEGGGAVHCRRPPAGSIRPNPHRSSWPGPRDQSGAPVTSRRGGGEVRPHPCTVHRQGDRGDISRRSKLHGD